MKNNICNVNRKCTGCSACSAICPVGAICMCMDDRGFYEPVVNKSCINCGKCRKVCPAINDSCVRHGSSTKSYFAAYNMDENKNKMSSSGGIFYLLAQNVIEKEGGVVFGTIIDDSNEVIFSKAETLDEVNKMMGSKYVYSKVNDIYVEVELELKNSRKVLFSGVSCQIAALYNFLGKNYDNLFTVEILCHGAPSPGLFEKYIKCLEKKYGQKVTGVNQRDFSQKWTPLILKKVRIVLQNGKNIVTQEDFDPYMSLFIRELCYRESCYNCQYIGLERKGDIVLGDFGGLGSKKKMNVDNKYGISFLMVNSDKGKKLIEHLDKLYVQERDLDEIMIFNSCLSKSVSMPQMRKQFMDDYAKMSEEALFDKYFYKDYRYLFRAFAKRMVLMLVGPKNIAKIIYFIKKNV